MSAKTDSIAAIGLKPRTGRAIAVVLSGDAASPVVRKRVELILTDPEMPETFQPYHHVMELPWNESLRRVKPSVRAIEKLATRALAKLVREASAEGMHIVGAGIVGAADRDPAKIGNYHIRAHAAEGLLFRTVLETAAETLKLPHRSFIEKNLTNQTIAELGSSKKRLDNYLASLGRTIGPPWRSEQRMAALTAWLMLAGAK